MEKRLPSEAVGRSQEHGASAEAEWALHASHPRDACDGFIRAGAVQCATSSTSSDRTHSESHGGRKSSDRGAPYVKNAWRRFHWFWCTRDHCKALRVQGWKVKVEKMTVEYFMSLCALEVGYSMSMCALRLAEWFRWIAVPHSDRCRQLTAATVCVVGVCFGAPLAPLLSATAAVLVALPSPFLLFPKRKLSKFEERMSDGFSATSGGQETVITELPAAVAKTASARKRRTPKCEEMMGDGFSAISTEPRDAIADPVPEPMLPEGVKPVSFKPASLEETNIGSSHYQNRTPIEKEATQTPSGRREHSLDSSQGRPCDGAPLISVATEPQPFLEPVFGGDLEMDAPPLPRSRLDVGVEEVEPARVPGKAGVALKEKKEQELSQAGQGRKRKAKGPEVGIAVCVLCPREVAVRAGGQSYCRPCFLEDVSDKPRLKDGKRLCRVSKCDKLAQNAKKYGGCLLVALGL